MRTVLLHYEEICRWTKLFFRQISFLGYKVIVLDITRTFAFRSIFWVCKSRKSKILLKRMVRTSNIICEDCVTTLWRNLFFRHISFLGYKVIVLDISRTFAFRSIFWVCKSRKWKNPPKTDGYRTSNIICEDRVTTLWRNL